jgi:hypothetical protein
VCNFLAANVDQHRHHHHHHRAALSSFLLDGDDDDDDGCGISRSFSKIDTLT